MSCRLHRFHRLPRFPAAVLALALTTVLALASPSPAPAAPASELPRAELPLFVTSAGQSPDALMVKMICDEVSIKADYDPLVEPVGLKKGLKTLIIAIGHSMKGLGAAGIDEEEDMARITKVIDVAQKAKIYVIAVHIGGNARRGSIADKFISIVVSRSNLAIVMEEGDEDKFFTKLTKENKVPMILIKEALDLKDLLKGIFRAK